MRIVNPDTLSKPKGYNHGVLASGSFLAVAGQVAWDKNETIIGPEFSRQFGQALRNVVDVVRAAGGGPENLINLTLFITSKEEYFSSLREIGAAYREIMGRHYPAMTCVVVKELIEPGAKIEIQGSAVL